jgi:hypothetical protein
LLNEQEVSAAECRLLSGNRVLIDEVGRQQFVDHGYISLVEFLDVTANECLVVFG